MRKMQIVGYLKRKYNQEQLNERLLLQKVIGFSACKNNLSELNKSNLEMLVWCEYSKNRSEYVRQYSGQANYSTYCIAIFSRIIKNHFNASKIKVG